ncbi:hypothetical protein N0V90_002552 [Kalmusia sp. IMI 367209]|nr:hypothetical protein N0V90_002552 [Kalmusia sp. IMI 367209]
MPVGFGFSVGDFLAVLKLVETVIDALRESSYASSSFRSLINELYALEQALLHVKRLDPDICHSVEIVALQQAASQCQRTIDMFYGKIQKDQPHLQQGGTDSKIKDAWEATGKEITCIVCGAVFRRIEEVIEDIPETSSISSGDSGPEDLIEGSVNGPAKPSKIRKQEEDVVLKHRHSGVLQRLSEHDFDRVAHKAYSWLHELDDVGYSRSDIAKLLLEEANDAPWIYFTPRDGLPPDLGKQQPKSLPENSEGMVPHSPPWQSKRHDVEMMIQQLCGLGGIAPISRSLEDWNGEVTFQKEYSVSLISYASSSKREEYPGSVLLFRLKRVLTNFCEATEVLRKAQLCFDHFTIVRADTSSADSQITGPGRVELLRIDIAQAIALRNEVDQLLFSSGVDTLDLSKTRDIAAKILQPLIPSGLELPMELITASDILHLCCLTAQFLCFGLVSFCQGHVGALELFFVNRPQIQSILLGSHVLNGKKWHRTPHIQVGLSNFTCLSQMTGGPLLTFSMSKGWFELSIYDAIPELGLDNFSSQLLGGDLTEVPNNEKEHHLEAIADDIVYTWGPGHFITSDSDRSMLRAIHVGGGVIYLKDQSSSEFHWEEGCGPENNLQAIFPRRSKLIVGALVIENPNPCTSWQCRRNGKNLVYLGVESPRWEPYQRQFGAQVGPDNAAFQGNQMWQKIPPIFLKQYQLDQEEIELLDFMGCYVGVQVSCCTGVARRVSLQKLLSELLPIFYQTYSTQISWHDWKNKYEIMSGLNGQDFCGWLHRLSCQFPEARADLMRTISRILNILKPTGLSRDQTYLLIAWPWEQDFHRGLKVSCKDERFWAQILADSKQSVTFAYMTRECLLLDGTQCQPLSGEWRLTTCLATAVTRYRDELEQGTDLGTLALQDGKIYHIWNAKLWIRLRVEEAARGTRLIASRSLIPSYMIKRLMYGDHWRRDFLIRERHHPTDDAREVVILTEG